MPRPAAITAVAVMLIALGSQFIVAFGGYAILVLLALTVRLEKMLIFPPCCWCVVTPILALLGIDFLRVGIGILYAYKIDIVEASFRIASFGVLAICCSIAVVVFLVLDLVPNIIRQPNIVDFLPVIIPCLFDAIAMLVAGVLLHNHSQKYKAWQSTYTSPTKASGYEDEED